MNSRRAVRWAFNWARSILAAIGILLIIYHLCFDLSVMVSGSMSPTLRGTSPENGDWVLTEKLSYTLRTPHRWELIAFRNQEYTPVMKRVVALPGERIRISDESVCINDELQPKPAALDAQRYYAYGNLTGGREYVCNNGYYVLGDDSRDSADSRYEGAVPASIIRGRPWLILWPLNRIGFVNP